MWPSTSRRSAPSSTSASRRFQGTVLLLGDSQLVVRQMAGEYKVRSERLLPYHAHLVRLVGEFSEVRFEWIPREENVRADELSKEALEREAPTARRIRPVPDPRAGSDDRAIDGETRDR